jgi:hypothetical protein
MPTLRPVIAWTLGVVGAAALSRLILQGWRRINAGLHTQPSVAEPDLAHVRKLRRDPVSGIYRPE